MQDILRRRIASANAGHVCNIEFTYIDLDEHGHGAVSFSYTVGKHSGHTQVGIPKVMGKSLLQEKKNRNLDALFRL